MARGRPGLRPISVNLSDLTTVYGARDHAFSTLRVDSVRVADHPPGGGRRATSVVQAFYVNLNGLCQVPVGA